MFSQHWYALLTDEARDISNREQLVLCIRWVSDSYEIHKDVVGLIQVSDTTAATIHKSLKDSLIGLGFQLDNCRGQAHDGASNFQGHISGVGKRFQDENPAAIPVHCLAHCVNLCLQEVARKVTCIKEFCHGCDMTHQIIPKTTNTGKKMEFHILIFSQKMCLKLGHPADHLFYTVNYQNSWCVVEHFLVHRISHFLYLFRVKCV